MPVNRILALSPGQGASPARKPDRSRCDSVAGNDSGWRGYQAVLRAGIPGSTGATRARRLVSARFCLEEGEGEVDALDLTEPRLVFGAAAAGQQASISSSLGSIFGFMFSIGWAAQTRFSELSGRSCVGSVGRRRYPLARIQTRLARSA